MPNFTLHGTPLDTDGMGPYYGPADLARRGKAAQLSDLISQNPSFGKKHGGEKPDEGYLSTGLPYNVEHLLSAYALKFGQDKAMQLMEVLPTMNTRDLLEVQKSVEGAAREMNDVRTREMETYRRNGVLYGR